MTLNSESSHLPQAGPPSLSIVIPTYNRRDRLKRLLNTLERLHAASPEFEVIVVVDGSTDGTVEMLSELRPTYSMQVLAQANRGPAAARNRAMAAAGGEVLLFLDDDVTPESGLIARHLAMHEREDDAVVIGPMRAPGDSRMAPWLQWEAAMLQKQYGAMLRGLYPPTPRQFYTANASIRTAHARAAGGFDESFTRAEDVEFAYRLSDRGLRFFFDPAAVVWHEPDRSFGSWLQVGYQYGRHDVLMTREHGRLHVLETAYEEWCDRHPLNKWLARAGVGHPWRTRIAVAGLRLLIGLGGNRGTGTQMALCSALFNLQYWRGIADATGLGPHVWEGGDKQHRIWAAPTPGR
jgi:GT2 family glycosyltransferase